MSKDVNQVILTGNVGQPPEIITFPDGKQLAKLTFATNKRWKHNGKSYAKAEWHTVVFMGKLAELVQEYVKKGNKLLIRGELCYKQWEDKEGKTHKVTEIYAEEFNVLSTNNGTVPEMPSEEL